MSENNLIFLAFSNNNLINNEISYLGCKNCGNKTYIFIARDKEFPLVKCACCGNVIGRIGWANEEEME